jgi:hypothetical protein
MVSAPLSLAGQFIAEASPVLPLASTPGGHRLGVNGLAFDQERSILYVMPNWRRGKRTESKTDTPAVEMAWFVAGT